MTFSIRTFLIVIALFACWLGALVSHVPLLVELVASATALLILLTLPLAIWDPRAEQRAFWTGFFVLALGNMLLTQYFNAYQQTGSAVATLILGAPQLQTPGYSPAPPTYFPPTNPGNTAPQSSSPADAPPTLEREERFYQPADPFGYSTYQPSAYYQRHSAIRTAVPNLFSLLAGVIGGWLTQWIYLQHQGRQHEGRQKEKAVTPVSASP